MDALARLGGTARRVGGKVVARGLKLAGYGTLLADTASSRWYLLLDCVPTCCGVLAMRFLVADVMGLHFFPLETISSFANSAIFILAIMLAGVLEDYKESESIPAEIASCFDAIAEQVSLAAALAAAKGEPRAVDARALSRELLGLLEAVFEFIAGLRDDTDLLAALTINAQYASAVVGAADVGVDGSDVLAPFAELRQHVLRMHVIKRTDFLASGYSLMELLVWITIIMACFGEYAARSEAYVNVGLTAMQFLYVIALLRDIGASTLRARARYGR